jgi:excisionase family DNA binding protein
MHARRRAGLSSFAGADLRFPVLLLFPLHVLILLDAIRHDSSWTIPARKTWPILSVVLRSRLGVRLRKLRGMRSVRLKNPISAAGSVGAYSREGGQIPDWVKRSAVAGVGDLPVTAPGMAQKRGTREDSQTLPFQANALCTVAEAAGFLRVSTRTVRRLIWSGRLESVRIGRSVRVPTAALARFLAKHMQNPAKSGKL